MSVTEPGPGSDPDEAVQGQGESRPATPSGGTDTTLVFSAVGSVEGDAEAARAAVEAGAIEALPEGSALLVVERGPVAGARFLLDAERTTAGRRPESDIFLDDVTVSRKHAEFVRREDGAFVVRDVGSLNGTYVGRERIDGERVLVEGDEVQIGKYRLVFYPSPRGAGGHAGW
jgi:pSer/pThr/pTyr-binding forkhead associated (FHA) protein